LLLGERKKIELNELRPYVAYPTNDQINQNDSEALKRLYLAVEDAEIYCHFPNLQCNGFGMVDLPGLGEVGESVAKMHLDGLENEVDHIILLCRPTDTDAYVGKKIVENIDQLHSIQSAISNKGNFISMLINKDPFAEQKGLVKILQNDITREINNGAPDSKFKVMTIDVKENNDVDNMLKDVLTRLTSNLPVMDGEVIGAALTKQRAIDTTIDETMAALNKTFTDLNRQFPSDSSRDFDDAEKLCGKISRELELIIVTQRNHIDPAIETEDKLSYFAKIEEIYLKNKDEIEKNGLWKGASWDEDAEQAVAMGKGPSGFFEKECNRIRVKIANSFEDMNAYYDARLDNFLKVIADVYRTHTGDFVPAAGSGKDMINSVTAKLESANLKMKHLEGAFSWLRGLHFDFRQNIFPLIREALIAIESDVETRNPRNLLDSNLLQGSLSEKTQMLKIQLQSAAQEANYDIARRLKECDQIVEEFIFAALEHFDDYAIRADGWHKEYIDLCGQFRDEIWPGKYNEPNTQSAKFKEAKSEIENIQTLIRGGSDKKGDQNV
jgi:hypothetical protein